MEISHSIHHHPLILTDAQNPYHCGGCHQMGFESRYTCKSGCNFVLHEQCAKPTRVVEHPFSKKCVLEFHKQCSLLRSRLCHACGDEVKEFHYKCLCTFTRRNLHPFCLNYRQTIDAADGLTLTLRKKAPSKCLHCLRKDFRRRIGGWASASSCGKYCYHVSCVREIINNNWSYLLAEKSDPFLAVKLAFPAHRERMQQRKRKNKVFTINNAQIAFRVLSIYGGSS